MNTEKVRYQQGDVLLFSNIELPKKSKALKTDLLWKGQQNHHRLKGKFKIMKSGDSLFVKSNGATLYHEEHKPIKIAKGDYRLGIVVEYDHFLEESRQVVD